MNFSDLLNDYIETVGCTAKELAATSGISAAAISRYRSGARKPMTDGGSLESIADGLAELSAKRGRPNPPLEASAIYDDLLAAVNGIDVDYETFLANLSLLISTLNISHNALARALSFDPSYISRILAGQRRPGDMQGFVARVADYAAQHCNSPSSIEQVANLIDADPKGLRGTNERAKKIMRWLSSNASTPVDSIDGFLQKVDEFDLDDFIRAVHFDEMKIPNLPFQLPTTRTYTGIEQMMESELDYLKATVLSRSMHDVIMYSDMPLEQMAADPEFPRKWMFGMALLLKKGLHLNMIHDANRPLPEMMLGLEGWIPMYMTGQVSPYYLCNSQCDVFCHLLKTSGTVALAGEAIADHQGEGRYIVTKNRDEVRYYRKRAERLLEKARPLMHIFTSERAAELKEYVKRSATKPGRRRMILSGLPLSTISAGLLERILDRNEITGSMRDRIRENAQARAKMIVDLAKRDNMVIEVPELGHEEFDEHPITLSVSGLFLDRDVTYSYEEYREHLQQTLDFAEARPSCTVIADASLPFRGIQILIHEGSCAIVSKNKAPTIHFAIEHPGMVRAFEQFSAPLVD